MSPFAQHFMNSALRPSITSFMAKREQNVLQIQRAFNIRAGLLRASSGPGVIYGDRHYGEFGGTAPKKIFGANAL